MKFKLFADSVHGRKYRERSLPCQDFAATLQFGDVQAIAIADGHGGKDYFRSDTGAQLAVETVFEQIKIFCKDLTSDEKFSDERIPNFKLRIIESWRKKILADWNARLSTIESEPRWQTVSDRYKARFTSADEKYIPVAYGTTLLCAVSIGTQVLIAQIGDGTCVVLSRDGEFKVPVPPDKENFANVTTSLCDADAFGKFRHVVLNCDENSTVAIFLSTDGLDDCYPLFDNEKYLRDFYRDTVVDSFVNNGFDATAAGLREDILPYMTERGSNDDISLAYLVTDDLNLLKATVEENLTVNAQTQSPQPQTQSPVNAQTQSSQPLTSPMVKPPPKVSPVHKAQDITILPPTVIPISGKEPRS